jgi:hypothetical protein
MATYRVLNPKGEVVDDGYWAFFDSSEGDRKY